MSIEGLVPEQYPPAGSMLIDSSGFIYYTTGDWSPSEHLGEYPCFLAYLPQSAANQQTWKSVDIEGIPYVKVFNQPITVFRHLYEVYNLQYDEQYGKNCFISPKSVVRVVMPFDYDNILCDDPELAEKIYGLLNILGALDQLPLIKIGGSIFFRTKRNIASDVDINFVGKQDSVEIWKKIIANIDSGTFSKSGTRSNLQFVYSQIVFDLQFSLGKSDDNPFREFELSPLDVTQARYEITNADLSIFYPSVYHTTAGTILSFRPGQRGLFRAGQVINFDRPLKKYRMTNRKGRIEEVFVVANDEYGA